MRGKGADHFASHDVIQPCVLLKSLSYIFTFGDVPVLEPFGDHESLFVAEFLFVVVVGALEELHFLDDMDKG